MKIDASISNNQSVESKRVLDTFAGVFTPSVLTILGIILFLRLGYVVGNADLGATRILQLLAGDRIFPLLNLFAKTSGSTENPRRCVLLAACIAYTTIGFGHLNLIAPVVSMFF